jgi:quercetin dioxygenase-like cupin family protein
MSLSRRDLCAILPAALLPMISSERAFTDDANILPSNTYPFEKLAPHKSNAAEIRSVLKGKLGTGESLEVHETTLPPGGMPHPPHHHPHSEMWLIREGTVELTIEGKSSQIGPGSVGFVKSNEVHGIKNVGTTPATYFVVAVGPGAA